MKQIIVGDEKFTIHYNESKYICYIEFKFSSASEKWIHKCHVKKIKKRIIFKDLTLWKTTSLLDIILLDEQICSNNGSFYYPLDLVMDQIKKIIDNKEKEILDVKTENHIEDGSFKGKVKDNETFKINYNGFKYKCKLKYTNRFTVGMGAGVDVYVEKYWVFRFLNFRLHILLWDGVCSDFIQLSGIDNLFDGVISYESDVAKKCAIKCIEFMEVKHTKPKLVT